MSAKGASSRCDFGRCILRKMHAAGRVLVADDDAVFRRHARRLLERRGHDVETVDEGNAVLSALSKSHFDALVADIHMPGNEELELLHMSLGVPVVLVTASATTELAVAALRGAALDFVVKPIDAGDFCLRVGEAVRRGRVVRTMQRIEHSLRTELDAVVQLRAVLQTERLCFGRTDSEALAPEIAQLLSTREREIVQLFRQSPNYDDVAARLFISRHTVKNHVRRIYKKLGVHSKAELVALLTTRHAA